jgi:hypothetical protein
MPATVHTHAFDGVCPVCGDQMVISRMTCGGCGSSLEGALRLSEPRTGVPAGPDAVGGDPGARATSHPLARETRERQDAERRFGRLARLDDAQLQFVEAFLRCRGVIKNVEDMLGISYPTVKARLASALETMGFGAEDELPAADRRQARREILAALAGERITTEQAHRLLAIEGGELLADLAAGRVTPAEAYQRLARDDDA